MTCLKVQNLITPFINDQLTLSELEEFLDHIQNCPDCREELEVYYTLLTAMKQLDEEKLISEDFGIELSEKIEKSYDRIIHAKVNFYRKKGVLVLIILLSTIFFGIQHYFIKKEIRNPVTESNFRLSVDYRKDRWDDIKEKVYDNYKTEKEK